MQNRWYSDNRDIVKWATLLHLARTHAAECIVQVVFLRPGPNWREARLRSGRQQFAVASEIWEQFPRDVARVRDLAVLAGLPIRILNEPFHVAERAEYVAQTARRIRDAGDGRKIVLVDPDSGLAPRHANGCHVTTTEVATYWRILRPADWLVVYQHRQRNVQWRRQARVQLAATCGQPASAVSTFTCHEIAHDVAFFALCKPPAPRCKPGHRPSTP